MVSSEVTPAYIIRAYIWAVLKENYSSVWHEDNYGGLIPIVPLGEEPELTEYSGPRIVYGYTLAREAGRHFIGSGTFAITIYDDNFRRMGKTITILSEALSRDDETATDLNNFSTKTPAFIGIRFGHVNGLVVGDSEPEVNEGGRQESTIVISFEYYSEYNVTTAV